MRHPLLSRGRAAYRHGHHRELSAIIASFAGWHIKDSKKKSFEMQYYDIVEKVSMAF